MSKNSWNADLFNFGTGQNYSINEIAAMYSCNTTHIKKRPGEAKESLAIMGEMEEKINYKPQHSIESYIRNWLKDNE